MVLITRIQWDNMVAMVKDLHYRVFGQSSPKDMDYVGNIVARYFEKTLDQLKSPSRKRELAEPRQIGMYLHRKYVYDISYREIGTYWGKSKTSGHCSVMHSEKVVRNRIETEKKTRDDVNAICRLIEFRNND